MKLIVYETDSFFIAIAFELTASIDFFHVHCRLRATVPPKSVNINKFIEIGRLFILFLSNVRSQLIMTVHGFFHTNDLQLEKGSAQTK